MIISSNDTFLVVKNSISTNSSQSTNSELFSAATVIPETTINPNTLAEAVLEPNRSYPAENGLASLLDETNRSYPAQGVVRSLLDGSNRSYPSVDKNDLVLAQAEATRLLEQINDPFLEFLLNQDNSEETGIFELVNTNSDENQNLVEAFLAEPNSDIEIGTLVFSNLYA